MSTSISRIKAPAGGEIEISSDEEFRAAVNRVGQLEIVKIADKARVDKVIANQKEALAQRSKETSAQQKPLVAACLAYAKRRRASLFDGKKSLEFENGICGFRFPGCSIKCLRGWTFPKVIEALKEKGMPRFVRVKRMEELDKRRLLELEAEDLAAVGLRIHNEEEFFIEPKVGKPESDKPEGK